jgi:death-on-curing protein
MAQRDYITLADALDLHSREINRHGGSHGIRDMGALESALFRPQSGYYDDIVWEACALIESVAVNHPFIDGNKRAAFAVMYAFLRINGYLIEADAMKLHRKLIGLFDTGKFELAELEKLFRPLIRAL